MSENKPKVPETKVKETNFIKFSQVQQSYLLEVRNRQVKEFNEAIESVYKELNLTEKILKAPPGMYKLRIQDLSGLDVLAVKPSGEDN